MLLITYFTTDILLLSTFVLTLSTGNLGTEIDWGPQGLWYNTGLGLSETIRSNPNDNV